MKRRVQVGDLRDAPQLTPQANPLSTYVRPAQEPVQGPPIGPNPWMQLGAALSDLSPKLSQFAQVKNEQEKAILKSQAETLASENRKNWKQLVKDRPDLMGANPWLQHYYDRAQLRIKSMDFDTQLKTAWSTDPIRENDDPNAFIQWANQRRAQFVQSLQSEGYDALAIGEAAAPMVQQTIGALNTEHVNYRQKRRVEIARETLGKSAGMQTFNIYSSFNTEAKTLDLSAVSDSQRQSTLGTLKLNTIKKFAEGISKEGTEAVQKGLAGNLVNMDIAEAVINQAESLEQDWLLDTVFHIKTGSGTLGDIPDIQKKVTEARRRIQQQRMTTEDWEWKVSERQRTIASEQLYSKAVQDLLANPNLDITKYTTPLTSMREGEKANSLATLKDTLQKRGNQIIEDPVAAAKLLVKSAQPGFNPQEGVSLVEQGKVTPRTVLSTLINNGMTNRATKSGLDTSGHQAVLRAQSNRFTTRFAFRQVDMNDLKSRWMKDVVAKKRELVEKNGGQLTTEILEQVEEYATKRADKLLGGQTSSQPSKPQQQNPQKPEQAQKPQQPNKRQQTQKRLSDIDAKLAELKRRKEQQQRGKQ